MKSIISLFKNIPTLETDRVILRKILPTDGMDMYEYSHDPSVTKYLSWYPHENPRISKKYVRFLQSEYKRGNFYDWGITLRKSGKLIGTCGFTSIDEKNNKAQVGYVLARQFWGNGIASESLARVIAFGFTKMSLERIEAVYMDGNDASRRVMEKCGMIHEGTERNSLLIKGEYTTIERYAILREDFFTMKTL